MKFACPNPNCDNGVGFGDRVCPKCGFPLSLGALLRHYRKVLADGIRRRAVTQCPYCKAIIPITSKECPQPSCRKPLTVNAALAPAQRRILQIAEQPNRTVLRRVQWTFFLLSVSALAGLLAYTGSLPNPDLESDCWMAIVYLVVIVVLIRLFLDPAKVRVLMRHLSPLVKFTLVIDYLTLALLLQVCIGVWWKKASILAGVCGSTFATIYIVSKWIWPLAVEAQGWFAEPAPSPGFNPSTPQGRTIETDDRTQ